MEMLSLTSDRRVKDSVYELTFGQYVEVVLGNVAFLVEAQDATIEEIASARQIIIAEFSELAGGVEFEVSLKYDIKERQMQLQLLGLNLSKKILTISYDEPTFDFLKEMGIIAKDVKYPSTVKELESILSRISNKIASAEIELLELEVHNKQTENVRDGKPKKKEFVKLLANLVRFTKTNISFDTNAAVVAELVNHMKRAQEEAENKLTK
jgi:hypothetical protein